MDEAKAVEQRDNDEALQPFRFLFKYYKPRMLYFEIFDAIRRILLGVTLGALSNSSPLRATIGIFISVAGAIVQREAMPYHDKPTSYLHYYAMWQIAFTFFCGLVITGRPIAYQGAVLGICLIFFNVSTPILAIIMHLGGFKSRALKESKYASFYHTPDAKINPIEDKKTDAGDA